MQWWTRRKPGLAIAVRSRPAKIAGWTLIAIVGLAALTAYGVALWKVPDWMHLTARARRAGRALEVVCRASPHRARADRAQGLTGLSSVA